MTDDDVTTYEHWFDYHAALFGLLADRDGPMLRLWAQLFAAEGFHPAELARASRQLALGDRPTFRTEHVNLLSAAVRRARAPAKFPPPDDRGVCADCGDTGFVSVPHPKWLRGEYQFTTLATTCHCLRGRWHHDGATEFFDAKRKRVYRHLTFYEYCAAFPGWKDARERHRATQEARRRAQSASEHGDQLYGPILKRLGCR